MEYNLSFAQFLDKKKNNGFRYPDRTAYTALSFDYHIKEFKTREAMAKKIRREQSKPSHWTNSIPIIPLSDGEGF